VPKSDPDIREGVLKNLKLFGSVTGSTFGEAVELIQPKGASMNGTKRAVNSLAYSTSRPHQVTILRPGVGSRTQVDRRGYTISLR
jgi:hypothetical protein